jgi:hypothetical protein
VLALGQGCERSTLAKNREFNNATHRITGTELNMKWLEYSRFATVTIVVAQILAGLVGIFSIVVGVIGLTGGSFEGLISIASGIVFLGIFFALARILNIDPADKDG